MKRPIYVEQSEEHVPGWSENYWFVVKSPNGKKMATSETYFSRSNAKRAARAFITLAGRPVVFTYWAGEPGKNSHRQVREVIA